MKRIIVEWPYVENVIEAYERAYQHFKKQGNEKEKDYADKEAQG